MFDPSHLNQKLSKYFDLRFSNDKFRFNDITIELDQTSMRLHIRYSILVGLTENEVTTLARTFVQNIHQVLDHWFLVDYSYINISEDHFDVKFVIFDEDIMEFINSIMIINTRKELAHFKLKGENRELFYKIQEFNILDG